MAWLKKKIIGWGFFGGWVFSFFSFFFSWVITQGLQSYFLKVGREGLKWIWIFYREFGSWEPHEAVANDGDCNTFLWVGGVSRYVAYQCAFFCGYVCSTSHSFLGGCCQLLTEQMSGIICSHTSRRRGGKPAGRKLEMRPEHWGTDLYRRIFKVWKTNVLAARRTFMAHAVPPDRVFPILMLSLMSSIVWVQRWWVPGGGLVNTWRMEWSATIKLSKIKWKQGQWELETKQHWKEREGW